VEVKIVELNGVLCVSTVKMSTSSFKEDKLMDKSASGI
jgi:hypothetical protein